jgi:hypothetical protein
MPKVSMIAHQKGHDSNQIRGERLNAKRRPIKQCLAAIISSSALLGCSTTPPANPQTLSAIANCRNVPRGLGNYEDRARCELEVESGAYLAKHPEMVAMWRELINDTLTEYAKADRAEQSIQQADINAARLREAAEAGTGCLTDQCGQGSEWNFPSNPPY